MTMIDTRDLKTVSSTPQLPDIDPAARPNTSTVTEIDTPQYDPERVLVDRYVSRAMLRTTTKEYAAPGGGWFAEITVVPNVWGHGDTENDAITDLEAVLRHWIAVKLAERDGDMPVIDLINLNVL